MKISTGAGGNVHEHINTFPSELPEKPVPEEHRRVLHPITMAYQARIGNQVLFLDCHTGVGMPLLEAYLSDTDWWEMGEPKTLEITVKALPGDPPEFS